MASTKKPSGLSIARNGLKFTFGWKIADADYGAGQKLQWRIWTGKWSAWTNINIGVKATAASVSFNASNYWPNTKTYFYGIQFRVQGKRKNTTKDGWTTTYDWSGYTVYTMDLYAPNTPTATATLDQNLDNRTTFAWNTSTSNTDKKPFANVEWESRVIYNNSETDGSKISWKSSSYLYEHGTGAASGSRAFTEDTELSNARASWTRWFRVRARGCGGNGGVKGCSYWRYAKHVYARPATPKVNSVTAQARNFYNMTWTAPANAAQPVDKVYVEYAAGIPLTNMRPPSDPNWTTAQELADTSGKDATTFLADRNLDYDECLWVRVRSWHDRLDSPSNPVLAKAGRLSTPEALTVQIGGTSEDPRASITATNTSAVTDSYLAVVYKKGSFQEVVGILPYGDEEIVVRYAPRPGDENEYFGVYAFQGTYVATGSDIDHVTRYAITANMTSSTLWEGGYIPLEPTNVTVSKSTLNDQVVPGEVLLTWKWAKWASANRCEISWSQNPYAWESTEEPNTYMLTTMNLSRWRISNLAVGTTWYFRVRLANEAQDGITWGPYSDTVSIDLAEIPSTPVVSLSTGVVNPNKNFTVSWVYTSNDGSAQNYAQVSEASVTDGVVTIGSQLAKVKGGTSKNISIKNRSGWGSGTNHFVVVRVKSQSGQMSEWSTPVPISVADPVTCTISQTSLQTITVGEGADQRTVTALTAMPLTATITGGSKGLTTLLIERAAEYHMYRPDDTELDGFDGETIALIRQNGDGMITVDDEELVGILDDGAQYRLVATVEDRYGQSSSRQIEFEVHWSHQAEIPTASARVENNAAVITVTAPESAVQGDVCDIYRLSAGLPELIVEGGAFGVEYVDPYPAIGRGFGHRCVHRTINGDYITADNQPAWVDIGSDDGDLLDIDYGVIDFDGNSLPFRYNIEVSNSWKKDFTETRYLGGSIVGDWNPGISRTASVNAVLVNDEETDYALLRLLAEYPGICHVRTPDGSSYAADVQVSDGLGYDTAGRLDAFTLEITRVDSEELDGIPYSEWVVENGLG